MSTPNTPPGGTDPTQCDRCGQPHRCRRHGDPGCTGHRKGSVPLEPCGNCRMQGQTVCRMHGGSAGQARRAASKRIAIAAAADELRSLGVPVPIDPSNAMLKMVWEANGNVEFLRFKVQELRQEALRPAVDDGDIADGAVWAPHGIAGPTGSVQKPFEAVRHVLVAMYDDEREKLVRWSKACRDAGVDERLVEVAEGQARQLADVLQGMDRGALLFVVSLLEAAGVDPALVARLRVEWARQIPVIVASEIERVAGPDAAGGAG